MSSISQVSDALKRVLTTHAKKLERETDGCRNAARPS
jgi:hypothetical protein